MLLAFACAADPSVALSRSEELDVENERLGSGRRHGLQMREGFEMV